MHPDDPIRIIGAIIGIGVFVLLAWWGLTEVLPGADRGY